MCNFKGSWGAHKERIIAFTQMPNILNMNWLDGMSLGDLCYLIGLKVIQIARSRANTKAKPTSVEDFWCKVKTLNAALYLHNPYRCQNCSKSATTNKTLKSHDTNRHDRSVQAGALQADKHDSFELCEVLRRIWLDLPLLYRSAHLLASNGYSTTAQTTA